ncbi:MAG: hypothetical protein AB1758_13420, partial [Candidatus Eremiobacterota bacterium]
PDRLGPCGQAADSVLLHRLAACLLNPGQTTLPHHLSAGEIRVILRASRTYRWEELRAGWQLLLGCRETHGYLSLRRIRMEVTHGVALQGCANLRAYRRARRKLDSAPHPHFWNWCASLVGRQCDPLAAAALAYLADAPRTTETLEFLARVGEAMNDRTLASFPRRWADEPELPPEALPFTDLGVPAGTLRSVLHHRALTGRTGLPGCLTALLGQTEREAREVEHLSRAGGHPERLRRLADPDLAARRWDGSLRRVRRQLERSLEVLRQEGLACLLRQATWQLVRRLSATAGRSRAGVFRMEFDALMLLRGCAEPAVLAQAVLHLGAGGSLDDLPANRRWLERARARGADVETWLNGVDAELPGDLRLRTERDPIEVLRMGTHFGTCLDLEHGCNAASTLANLMDANKQVVYARKPGGQPVSRVLIAATQDGGLLAYPLYGDSSMDREVRQQLLQFARRCRLQPRNSGRPASLHGLDWYDDGPAPWGDAAQESSEEGFLRAAGGGSEEWPQTGEWVAATWFYSLVRGRQVPGAFWTFPDRETARCLTTLGHGWAWGRVPDWRDLFHAHEGPDWFGWNPDGARAMAHEVLRRWRPDQFEREWSIHVRPPACFACLEAGTLLRLLAGLEGEIDNLPVAPWARVLEVALLRGPGPARRFRHMAERPSLRLVLLRVAARIPLPIGDRLSGQARSLPDDGPLYLALARQLGRRAVPLLRQAVLRHPHRVEPAVALLRAAPEDASLRRLVRRTCTVPAASLLEDPDRLNLARELSLDRISRALWQSSRPLPHWYDRLPYEEALALLGHPDYPSTDLEEGWRTTTRLEELRRSPDPVLLARLPPGFHDPDLEDRMVDRWPLSFVTAGPPAFRAGLLLARYGAARYSDEDRLAMARAVVNLDPLLAAAWAEGLAVDDLGQEPQPALWALLGTHSWLAEGWIRRHLGDPDTLLPALEEAARWAPPEAFEGVARRCLRSLAALPEASGSFRLRALVAAATVTTGQSACNVAGSGG